MNGSIDCAHWQITCRSGFLGVYPLYHNFEYQEIFIRSSLGLCTSGFWILPDQDIFLAWLWCFG
jgi:hypothetical protein